MPIEVSAGRLVEGTFIQVLVEVLCSMAVSMTDCQSGPVEWARASVMEDG